MMKGSMFKVAWQIEKGVRTKLPSWLKGACAQSCLLDWKRRAHLEGRAHLKGARSSLPGWWKGARSLERGALKFAWLWWKGAPSLLGTYWFSIQCPDGVVQVVSMRGVAVSITGCRLKTRPSQIIFYRQPNRQASTPCPHPHAETAELSDAVFSTARKIQELK